jgi:hypothetical protein
MKKVIEKFGQKFSSETLFLIFVLWLFGAQTVHWLNAIRAVTQTQTSSEVYNRR